VDNANHEQRPRASLRGKGREILLGQQSDALPEVEETTPETSRPDRVSAGRVDASSLSLTPEETEALLDFSPVSPAYETALPLPAPPAQEPPPVAEETASPAWWEEEVPGETEAGAPEWWAGVESGAAGTGADLPVVAAPLSLDEDVHGALPLAERSLELIVRDDDLPYYAAPPVDRLIPPTPEAWSDAPGKQLALETFEPPEVFARLKRFREQTTDQDEGGLVMSDEAAGRTATPGISDPFAPVAQRPTPEELFDTTSQPDQELLTMLVDDGRIRKLSRQIEALQEDLAQNVSSDRASADEYQKELLRASSLLMASRANYDDARAIVYRVRTDMNRRRKIDTDIMRYRPLLLNYYVGWGIALVVLFLLKELFAGVTEAVGVEVFAALYYPMLFGIVGALISGYLTLERHTTRLRDFDPMHISWYLFSPLLGGVMGLLMVLLASIVNEDLLRQSASETERAITYLLCVGAGMNQNNVLRQLNDLLDRFGRSSSK
jgi:hypothetical protein